jgi:flagellar protein FliO/FliZ
MMKNFILAFIIIISLITFQSTIQAASTPTNGDPSVFDGFQDVEDQQPAPSLPKEVENQSTSLFPLFLKFIGSFILVVGLLIYLMRYLSKRSRLMHANGPILPLGGHVLGNNRSLQVVLIGQTIYIIGVGDTVTLVRTISQGEEYQHLLESYENQTETMKPADWLAKNPPSQWKSVFKQHLQKMKQENGEE